MTAQELKVDPKSSSQTSSDGAAWAALLAAAIGCAGFGVLTVLSEAVPAASKALAWYVPSGSLSGVALASIAVWLAAWGILGALWKGRSIRNERRLMVISVLLVLLGILLTFPPFYDLL